MVPSHGKDSDYVGNNHSFVDFNGTEFLVLNSNTDDKLAGNIYLIIFNWFINIKLWKFFSTIFFFFDIY